MIKHLKYVHTPQCIIHLRFIKHVLEVLSGGQQLDSNVRLFPLSLSEGADQRPLVV